MKRKTSCLFLIFTMFFFSTGQVSAAIQGFTKPAKEIKVFIDSREKYLQLPILCDTKNSRTLYPFRELLESVGANVNWEQHTKTARAYYNGIDLEFPMEQNYYFVNGEKRMMDTKTTSDPDEMRTYIPIRYAFEALGYEVDWIPCLRHDEIRVSKLGDYEPVSDERFVEMHNDRSDGLYSKYTTSNYYDIDTNNKRLLLKDGYDKELYGDYEIKEEINLDINRQIYDLTKVLIGKENYVFVNYYTSNRNLVLVRYTKNESAAFSTKNPCYFEVTFYEREYCDNKSNWLYDDFSDKVCIDLDLSKLWNDFEKEAWSTPYYEKKLRDSLIAIFGANDGNEIYKYVFGKYVQMRNLKYPGYTNQKEVKKIGNVQIDFGTSEGATLSFSFSFIE